MKDMKEKTSKILDRLGELTGNEGHEVWGDGELYQQLMTTLKKRFPFLLLFDEKYERSISALWETVEDLKKQIESIKERPDK